MSGRNDFERSSIDETLVKTKYGSSQISDAQGQFSLSSLVSITADAFVWLNWLLYTGFARKEMDS